MRQPRAKESAAQRLVRSYPKQWRARYGDEFTQLLIDESADGELSLARKLDVFGHGVWTRLAYAGLAGSALDSQRRLRSMLVGIAVLPAVFVALALGIWAQLTIGWQWSESVSGASTAAMWLMSAGLFALGALAVLVIPPLVVLLARAARGRGMDYWWPVMVSLVAGTVLYVGCHHFSPHWPGTGGHALSRADFAPSWMARLGWAGTLWISSYWAHPDALGSFPAGELAWMVISPVAWFALILSVAMSARRLEMTPKLRRQATGLCAGTATSMVLFLAGAMLWVCSEKDVVPASAIDLAIVAVLAAALIATTHLLRRLTDSDANPARSLVR